MGWGLERADAHSAPIEFAEFVPANLMSAKPCLVVRLIRKLLPERSATRHDRSRHCRRCCSTTEDIYPWPMSSKIDLFLDLQRISYAFQARLASAIAPYGLNQLQMWAILLIAGLHANKRRLVGGYSASEVATELCTTSGRVSMEITVLIELDLIEVAVWEKGADRRIPGYVLTPLGIEMSGQLATMLVGLQSGMAWAAGLRKADRVVEPQRWVAGLWLTGDGQTRMPTLKRITKECPEGMEPGCIRGDRLFRLTSSRKKV